jgi:hypothetical protein
LNRLFFPKRNDEKPRRSNVRILSAPDNSAIQTGVASRKSIGNDYDAKIGEEGLAAESERTLFVYDLDLLVEHLAGEAIDRHACLAEACDSSPKAGAPSNVRRHQH